MNKSIFKLALHESILLREYRIMRVPGGWIYRFKDINSEQYGTTGIFVPEMKGNNHE